MYKALDTVGVIKEIRISNEHGLYFGAIKGVNGMHFGPDQIEIEFDIYFHYLVSVLKYQFSKRRILS